ncbi:NAD(P)-binding protein [Stipitochalara longipes BDJ]|nr:NAD(P)-binding protein [Stipitochalara longipes BDJ]
MTESSISTTFDPVKDIPSLNGKVILITGANTGLGKASLLSLAAHNPSTIYLGSRSLTKGSSAAAEILHIIPDVDIKVLELDLSSFESVRKAAAKVTAEAGRLDILMLNAGIMGVPGGVTEEGYEIQFGTNHMGHALLTKLLLPLLEKTASEPNADVRIVSVTSHTHQYAPNGGIRFDALKSKAEQLPGYARYGQSKLANILWVREMARRYPMFVIAAVHPGVVDTGLLAKATDLGLPAGMSGAVNRSSVSVEEGVKNQLWAAAGKDVASGEYYEPVGVGGKTSDYGRDDELAKKFWEWTESDLDGYLAESGSGLKL